VFDCARNGRGAMDFLRRNAGVLSKNATIFQNEDLLEPYVDRRVMFLAAPNRTNLPLFWSFGWHGNKTLAKMDVLYALPRVLFWVPFLRELLVFSGAVEGDEENLIWLMKKEARAICYAPGRMQEALTVQSRGCTKTCSLNPEFITQLIAKEVVVVPVVFVGENKRYPPLLLTPEDTALGKNNWYKYLVMTVLFLRKRSYQLIDYPFPLFFGWNRKEKVTTIIGPPIDTKTYLPGHPEKVCNAVQGSWASMGNTLDNVLLIEDVV